MAKLWRRVVIPVASKYRDWILAYVRSTHHFRETFIPRDYPAEHDDDNAQLNAELVKKSTYYFMKVVLK